MLSHYLWLAAAVVDGADIKYFHRDKALLDSTGIEVKRNDGLKLEDLCDLKQVI